MKPKPRHQPRRWQNAIANRAAVIAAAALVLSSLRFFVHFYPIELLHHFQFQYFMVSAVSLMILTALRRWRMVILACAAFIVSSSAVAPMWLKPQGVDEGATTTQPTSTIRILHANVLSSNTRHSLLLELIAQEKPDLVILQEVNTKWLEALELLANDFPFTCLATREDNFGMAVYSRIPLHDAVVRQLGGARLPSMVLQIQLDDVLVDVIASHPMPPSSAAAQSSRDEQLMQIASFAERRPHPLIIVGDLNTTIWTASYHDLCEELGLTNARKGFGVLASWPAHLPAIVRIPIDHCLISDEFLVRDCRLGPKIGSDHLPLIIDLQIRR